jgi:hypothetical protein
MLKSLLNQLEGHDIHIWDDNSKDLYKKEGLTYSILKPNYGKKLAWKKFNIIFDHLKTHTDYDYYIFLPDDCELCNDFVKKSVSLWEGIRDNKKICLSFSHPDRTKQPCFTAIEPVDCGDVIKTQWTDMAFICGREFINRVVVDPVDEKRWDKNPNLSSGVGSKISHLFYTRWNLYNVKTEMMKHIGNDDSKMNPIERKINKL